MLGQNKLISVSNLTPISQITVAFHFPAFHFWLFPQTVCALLETTNGFDSYPSLQGESALCKIAHEFKDDLAKRMARQSAAYVQIIAEQAR
jgi:hypothetical protein